jgi:hypothetical protein
MRDRTGQGFVRRSFSKPFMTALEIPTIGCNIVSLHGGMNWREQRKCRLASSGSVLLAKAAEGVAVNMFYKERGTMYLFIESVPSKIVRELSVV